MTGQPVTVEDLLATDPLREATLVGGAAGLPAAVARVVLVEPAEVADAPLPDRAAVVFAVDAGDGSTRRAHLVDVLLRRAHSRHARAVLVCGRVGTLSAASGRLADTYGLPLVHAPTVRPLELAVTLRTLVATPEVTQADSVLSLVRSLRSARRTLPGILDALGRALGASVAACTAQGVPLAGERPTTPVDEIVTAREVTAASSGGLAVAILPVSDPDGVPRLWVVAERPGGGGQWRQQALRALTVCRGELAAWLAGERLTAERDARLRSTLLTELLEHGDALTGPAAEQAAMIGWQLDGWHTGIHFTIGVGEPPALADETLAHDVADAGLDLGPLIARTDGWSVWLTEPNAPGPQYPRRIAHTLETGLATFAAHARGLRVAAGVGTPARGAGGVVSTLTEARQAALVAASTGPAGAVRTAQHLGASRLLLDLYTSRGVHDEARQLLAPLLTRAEQSVLRTLETYLDTACSTAHTARALGVHRNTVTQRMTRAQRLLGVPLDHPDTRLALQLALRALRSVPAQLPGPHAPG